MAWERRVCLNSRHSSGGTGYRALMNECRKFGGSKGAGNGGYWVNSSPDPDNGIRLGSRDCELREGELSRPLSPIDMFGAR